MMSMDFITWVEKIMRIKTRDPVVRVSYCQGPDFALGGRFGG